MPRLLLQCCRNGDEFNINAKKKKMTLQPLHIKRLAPSKKGRGSAFYWEAALEGTKQIGYIRPHVCFRPFGAQNILMLRLFLQIRGLLPFRAG